MAALVGRGTGLDDSGLTHKRQVLERSAARVPGKQTAECALREFGGFEIAMIAGAIRGAARQRRLVIVDGFIVSVAALAAVQFEASCRDALVFAHRSAESGHRRVLEALGADPLLDLSLRLGEGTGALLAWPLLRAAAAMLRDMASFESAAVSGPR